MSQKSLEAARTNDLLVAAHKLYLRVMALRDVGCWSADAARDCYYCGDTVAALHAFKEAESDLVATRAKAWRKERKP